MPAARLYQRKWLFIRLPIAVVALALMAWLWLVWLPMPPGAITLSSGATSGRYYAYAQSYSKALAERGVTVTVINSQGSGENLDRLTGRAQPRADIAFIQGGIASTEDARPGNARVLTLARVDVEPLWIFSRVQGVSTLQQLQGLRVSLGETGSGGRRLALALLEQVRLAPKDMTDVKLPMAAAAQALRQGTLDVMILVAAPEAPVVQQLIDSPGIALVQLRSSAAITENLTYLQPRLLPQGSMDVAGKLPARDATLLATTSSLVAREDLHPALQRMVTDVARQVHAPAGLFHRAGEFPSLRRSEFPASPQARRTLAQGLPWLEQQLPFWWAQVVWRLLVICLPVALLALWLARMAPAYLRWLVESRLSRWYGELKYIEHDLSLETTSGLDLNKYLSRLQSIEKRMLAFSTPQYLMPRWFMLKQHVAFVRAGLYRMRGR